MAPPTRLDVGQPRYDQSTYAGRLQHFSALTSPLHLLAARSALSSAQELLRGYREGEAWALARPTDEVWRAKYLVDSTLHPDTGEPIPLPFRMCAFVPTNMLIVAGMLRPKPSVANQSVNVGCGSPPFDDMQVAFNYFNANKTTPLSASETGLAYTAAVGSSCAIALGLRALVGRVRHAAPGTRALLARLVPFGAVVGAGVVNVFVMRGRELVQGIEVQDAAGRSLGKSTAAGYVAVSQVAVSRVATSIPVLVLPGLVLAGLERRVGWYQRSPRLHIPIQMGVIAGCLLGALPLATALFPQRASLPRAQVEPNLRNTLPPEVERVYFNRGL